MRHRRIRRTFDKTQASARPSVSGLDQAAQIAIRKMLGRLKGLWASPSRVVPILYGKLTIRLGKLAAWWRQLSRVGSVWHVDSLRAQHDAGLERDQGGPAREQGALVSRGGILPPLGP